MEGVTEARPAPGTPTGSVPVAGRSSSSKSTSGMRRSNPTALWVSERESATAMSALIRPSLRAATAMRVWQRVSIEWMAAVLSYGPHAVLSHGSAAALWDIRDERERCIHVTTLPQTDRRQAGIIPHRRSTLGAADVTRHRGIPVTTPVRTLVDLAVRLPPAALAAAVNGADKLDLVTASAAQ